MPGGEAWPKLSPCCPSALQRLPGFTQTSSSKRLWCCLQVSTCRSSASQAGRTTWTTQSTCRIFRKVRQVFRHPDSLLPLCCQPGPQTHHQAKALSPESSRLCEVIWFPYLPNEETEAHWEAGHSASQGQVGPRCHLDCNECVQRGAPSRASGRTSPWRKQLPGSSSSYCQSPWYTLCVPLHSEHLKHGADCASAAPMFPEILQGLAHSSVRSAGWGSRGKGRGRGQIPPLWVIKWVLASVARSCKPHGFFTLTSHTLLHVSQKRRWGSSLAAAVMLTCVGGKVHWEPTSWRQPVPKMRRDEPGLSKQVLLPREK